MKLRTVALTSLLLIVFSPAALADVSGAIAPTVDFGTKVNEAVTSLVTGVLSPVMGFGWVMLGIFGVYALLQTVLSAQLRALASHHVVPAAVILACVAVLFRVLIAALMLGSYTAFHRIFPALANGLTATVSSAELTEAFSFFNSLKDKLPHVGMLEVLPALITGLLLVFSAVASFGLTIMTSMSHAIVGLFSICGPLMIPFYVLPRFDSKFWNWLDNLVVYSMYRFVAACFGFLWAHVYVAIFAAMTTFTVGAWMVAIVSFIIVTISCVFTALKIPEVTHTLFGGTGAIANDISNTAQRAVLGGVSKWMSKR